MKYYYIHGYGSTGERAFSGLKNAGLKDLNLVRWDSDQSYNDTIRQISRQMDLNDDVCVIASSFGGYLAAHLPYNGMAQFVLVNPLTNVYEDFYLPKHSDTFTKEVAETYINKKDTIRFNGYPITVMLAKNDEVLDYRIAEKFYKTTSEIKYISGGHVLTDFKTVVDEILLNEGNLPIL